MTQKDISIGNMKTATGAVLIELAFILPIIFLTFFLFLSITLAINASSSLYNLMGDVAIIAPSRSDAQLLNLDIGVGGTSRRGIIDSLNSWYESSPSDFSGFLGYDPTLRELFVRGVTDPDFLTHMQQEVFHYSGSSQLFTQTGGITPNDFPIFYLYSLAYIYQGMSRSVGSALKYPCTGSSNCLSCGFYATIPGANEITAQDFDNIPIIGTKDLHMICKYKPTGLPEIRKVIQVEQSEVIR